MERIREIWDGWWKVLAIWLLIIGAVWFVWECNQAERSEFLNCFEDRIPPGYDVLYDVFEGESEPYYGLIDRQQAIDVAEECYDDTRGTNVDGEPLE